MKRVTPIPWKTFYALYGLGILCAVIEVFLIVISHAFDGNTNILELASGFLFLFLYIPLLISPLIVYAFLYSIMTTLSIPLNFLMRRTKLSVKYQQLITLFLPPIVVGLAVVLPIILHLYYEMEPSLSDSDIGITAHIGNWGVIPFYVLGEIVIYLVIRKNQKKKDSKASKDSDIDPDQIYVIPNKSKSPDQPVNESGWKKPI